MRHKIYYLFTAKKQMVFIDFHLVETSGYYLYGVSKVTGLKETSYGYNIQEFKHGFIAIDKSKYEARFLSRFYNDLIGRKVNPAYLIKTLFNQPDENYVVEYDALSFLEMIDKIEKDPEIDIRNRKSFIELKEGLTENSNQVLLVGKFKNNFNF